MIYQQLPKSDLKISSIGFGCMSLHPGEHKNEEILHRALDEGINYFDTADLYDKGANEELLGKAFKEKRNRIILATKVGNQWKEDGSGWTWNPSKEYILSCVEKSLKRLQTDHIDLYQLHGGTIDDPMDESIEAFEQLVKEGKIRYYGISSIRPNVIRYWIKHSNIISVMMQYSLLDRRPEEECLPLLKENGIGVLARGSLAQGLLAGKEAKPYLDHTAEEVRAAAREVKKLSASKRSAAQTAIQFVLGHPAVVSAVAGIRTAQQLEEALDTITAPPLFATEMEELRHSIAPNFYKEHR